MSEYLVDGFKNLVPFSGGGNGFYCVYADNWMYTITKLPLLLKIYGNPLIQVTNGTGEKIGFMYMLNKLANSDNGIQTGVNEYEDGEKFILNTETYNGLSLIAIAVPLLED